MNAYAWPVRAEDLLERTDWSAVQHAYEDDPGFPSAPQILAALLHEDADRQGRALADLHDIVHHQGAVYSATAPAALFVVAVLGDRRTLTPVPPRHGIRGVTVPLRVALLCWLTSVMHSAAEQYQGQAGRPADVEACRAVRPAVWRAAHAMRGDPDSAVASAALATALASLLDAPELAHHRAETTAWAAGPALARLDMYCRVMAVMTLQTWGCDTTSTMETDPDPLVRAAAALTPALAGSAHGTRALLDVLLEPSAGTACTRDYPHFGPIYMTRFLPAAIERASLEDLIPTLDQFLAHAPPVVYHCGWGPLLRAKAFPGGYPLTTAQQALRYMIAERCFGPAAPPQHSDDDARMALSDLVP